MTRKARAVSAEEQVRRVFDIYRTAPQAKACHDHNLLVLGMALIGGYIWSMQNIFRRLVTIQRRVKGLPVKPFVKVTEAGIIAPFTR